MNMDIVWSLVRQVLLFGGGFIVAKGWTDSETMLAVVGALMTIATSVFATWSRTNKSIVASAAAKVPVSETAQKSVGIQEPVKPA